MTIITALPRHGTLNLTQLYVKNDRLSRPEHLEIAEKWWVAQGAEGCENGALVLRFGLVS